MLTEVVGYVVKEALKSVHSAHDLEGSQQLNFHGLRKYLITWPRSGPDYYASIDITVFGQWPAVAVNYASTR